MLDLVISSESNKVDKLEVVGHFASSDHNMVEFNLVLKSEVCDTSIYKLIFVNVIMKR